MTSFPVLLAVIKAAFVKSLVNPVVFSELIMPKHGLQCLHGLSAYCMHIVLVPLKGEL